MLLIDISSFLLSFYVVKRAGCCIEGLRVLGGILPRDGCSKRAQGSFFFIETSRCIHPCGQRDERWREREVREIEERKDKTVHQASLVYRDTGGKELGKRMRKRG